MSDKMFLQLNRELLMASIELSAELSKKELSELSALELQFLKTVDKVNEAYLTKK